MRRAGEVGVVAGWPGRVGGRGQGRVTVREAGVSELGVRVGSGSWLAASESPFWKKPGVSGTPAGLQAGRSSPPC
jgi:hypothetical protein